MNKTIVIGLTGPSGAGKSTLCELIKKDGFKIIDADEIAKEILDSRTGCVKRLVEFFGPEILTDDLKINRKALAAKAFSSKLFTEELNQITHPFIYKEIKHLVDTYECINFEVIVIDAALLFESEINSFCYKTISVLCDKNTRKERIINRDNLSKFEAENRICAQKKDEFYKSKSDFVIYNRSDKISLLNNFRHVFNCIQENFNEASN